MNIGNIGNWLLRQLLNQRVLIFLFWMALWHGVGENPSSYIIIKNSIHMRVIVGNFRYILYLWDSNYYMPNYFMCQSKKVPQIHWFCLYVLCHVYNSWIMEWRQKVKRSARLNLAYLKKLNSAIGPIAPKNISIFS